MVLSSDTTCHAFLYPDMSPQTIEYFTPSPDSVLARAGLMRSVTITGMSRYEARDTTMTAAS